MKRISDGQEPVVAISLIVKPIEIEIAPVVVVPKFGNIAVAIAVLPDGKVQNTIYTTTPRVLSGLNLIWGLKTRQYFAPSIFIFMRIVKTL